MAYTYFKAYHEILDDRPIAQLPDHLWRRMFEMFAFASRQPVRDGSLPSVADMAWVLHCDEASLGLDLEALCAMENPPIERRGDGWFVTNFEKRNAPDPNAQRQAAWRDRNATVTRPEAGVTPALPDNRQQTTDTDKTTDTDEEAPGAPVVVDDLSVVSLLEAFGIGGKALEELSGDASRTRGLLRYANDNGLGAGWVVSEYRSGRSAPVKRRKRDPAYGEDYRRYISGPYAEFIDH